MKILLLVFFTCFEIFSSANAEYTDNEKNRILREISDCKWNSEIKEFKKSNSVNAYSGTMEYFKNCDIYKTPGVAYEWGRLVFPDVIPYLIKKATKENDSDTQYALGEVYAFGVKDIPKDYQKALKWYKKSAEQGNAKAQFNLGVLYANGKHVKQDYKESIKWHKLAIEQGLPEAKKNLGNMYLMFGNIFTGDDSTSEDHKQAAKWYKLAVEQGDFNAHLALGVLHAKGTGVKKDVLKARKLFREVYENGSALKAEKAENLLNKYKL